MTEIDRDARDAMPSEGGPSPPDAVYSSKRDPWLTVVLGLTIVILLFGAVVVWLPPGPFLYRIGFTALCVLISGFVLWIFERTRYELRDDELVIRCGPMRWRRSVHAIREVSPSHNPLSGPALSLDRLAIHLRDARLPILISPAAREEFLDDLLRRAPHLERRGERLVER